MSEIIKTVPENGISVQDVEELAEELAAYQAIYEPFFSRIEEKQQAQGYIRD